LPSTRNNNKSCYPRWSAVRGSRPGLAERFPAFPFWDRGFGRGRRCRKMQPSSLFYVASGWYIYFPTICPYKVVDMSHPRCAKFRLSSQPRHLLRSPKITPSPIRVSYLVDKSPSILTRCPLPLQPPLRL
jgi:hypothetical protein